MISEYHIHSCLKLRRLDGHKFHSIIRVFELINLTSSLGSWPAIVMEWMSICKYRKHKKGETNLCVYCSMMNNNNNNIENTWRHLHATYNIIKLKGMWMLNTIRLQEPNGARAYPLWLLYSPITIVIISSVCCNGHANYYCMEFCLLNPPCSV